MDAQNFSTEEGTRILQWSKNYGSNQRWMVKWETDGYYRLSPSYAPDMYLSAGSDGKARLTYNGNADTAKWLFLAESADGAGCRLTPKSHPGKVAVVQYASQSQGEEIILYDDNGSSNGYWSLIDRPVTGISDYWHRILNVHTNLYLGYGADNAARLWNENDTSHAYGYWVVSLGNGFYRLTPYQLGTPLAVEADGVTVGLRAAGGYQTDADQWYISQDGRFHSKRYPDKVLAVENDQAALGAAVILVDEKTALSEVWTIE